MRCFEKVSRIFQVFATFAVFAVLNSLHAPALVCGLECGGALKRPEGYFFPKGAVVKIYWMLKIHSDMLQSVVDILSTVNH